MPNELSLYAPKVEFGDEIITVLNENEAIYSDFNETESKLFQDAVMYEDIETIQTLRQQYKSWSNPTKPIMHQWFYQYLMNRNLPTTGYEWKLDIHNQTDNVTLITNFLAYLAQNAMLTDTYLVFIEDQNALKDIDNQLSSLPLFYENQNKVKSFHDFAYNGFDTDAITTTLILNNYQPDNFTQALQVACKDCLATAISIEKWFKPKNITFVNLTTLKTSDESQFLEEVKTILKNTAQIYANDPAVQLKELVIAKPIDDYSSSIANPPTQKQRKTDEILQRIISADNLLNDRLTQSNTQKQMFIHYILKTMKTKQSISTYKSKRQTYSKPNRRYPNDPNRKGQSNKTEFKPVLHIFLDTSGSISDNQIQEALKLISDSTKQFNGILKFTSFADKLSETVTIQTKNNREMYNKLHKLPKITGGTDFTSILRYMDKTYDSEIALVLTDFEYTFPSNLYLGRNKTIVKNIYYMSIGNSINPHSIKRFGHSLIEAGHPQITKHIMGYSETIN